MNLNFAIRKADAQSASRPSHKQAVATKKRPKSRQPPGGRRSQTLAVCVCLLLAVLAVFGQAVRFDFVNYDDPEYVYENPAVTAGLSARGIAWAFTECHASNWHPLTWISHMADCQLYGLRPGGHHLTSVALHAATAIVLFLVLRQMTGGFWPSALAAALFAVHPLRVQSVVWVAERKDVLGGLFFALTLAAYVRYARLPFSLPRYLTVLTLFACGLMAKPMLVTLPCVLLLIDGWPLGRLFAAGPGDQPDSPGKPAARQTVLSLDRKTLLEKVPLFALSVAACWVTILAQQETISDNVYLSLSTRIANALVAYMAYVGQFFLPLDLAAFYPHPGGALPAWKVGGSLAALLMVSLLAVVERSKYPYLLVGWLWYLGMLAPVIGIIQVGSQAMADRYTYLPQIGLCIALAWGAADLARAWSAARRTQALGAVLVLAAMMVSGWSQATYWQNSETLWRRALACTTGNWLAHYNLGIVLDKQGKPAEAIAHYEKSLENSSGEMAMNAHVNLGNALVNQGRIAEAVAHYEQALEIRPNNAMSHNNLAVALDRLGKAGEASTHYRKVLEIQPEFAPAHFNLGNNLARQGKLAEAVFHYEKTLQIQPGLPAAQLNLVDALAAEGKLDAAIAECRRAIEAAEAHNNEQLAAALRERLRRCQSARPQ